MWSADIEVAAGPVFVIPIPATSVDVPILRASGTLYGWSLRDATAEASQNVEGSVVAPAALTTIATTTSIPAGEYTVNWEVELLGAAAAGDANNFELIVGGNPGIPSLNAGAAGQYPQVPEQVFLLNNQLVSIKNIGAGTAGVTYAVQLGLVPASITDCVAELRNSGGPLAEFSLGQQGANTQWLGPLGIDITQDLTLHVIQGVITGAIYASFDRP